MARDMTLFLDDDGSAYQVYASEENGTLQISKLTDDFLAPSGRYARIAPGGFNEAPVLFKHGGKYFLITSGCTGWSPNAARSFSADSIWGPWQALGNPCVGENAATTFGGQGTGAFQAPDGSLIFMIDQWRPDNPIDGRYAWLPIQFEEGRPVVRWLGEWSLGQARLPNKDPRYFLD